ncbi:heavy metal sensor histidine kinase [Acidovorax sp. sif1233]|uniref:heavy metal sensor histidine kinase n=1 Tax=Acidovorax sp. sif1233 TaxID=2854792 RepID=UPI001C490E22|nr:heavy metal sensor histidine kinase [Acidovorax sp. sif1233]MBV7453904.1 heavy metal sensor histidine kinase [Acidovorax sp. sif1233]
MTGTRAPGSLRRRLSWWLAAQSLAGLGAVCLLVYLVTAAGFRERQDSQLEQKEAVVRHLLSGGGMHPMPQPWNDVHLLDDFLAGHDNFRLRVSTGEGEVLYPRVARGDPPLLAWRERSFEVASQRPEAPGRVLRVWLALDIQADEQLLRRMAVTLWVAALAGAVVVSLGGFTLVHLGLSPVRALSAQVRALSPDTLHQRLGTEGQPAELQPLVEQFNGLLGRLEKAYVQVEGFNADVAHELRTPLATLQASNELALRGLLGGGAGNAGELGEVLASNLEELQRLTGIVNDMLFLSQADRGAGARRESTPSLARVVAQVAEFHEAALADAGLALHISGDAAGQFDVPLLHRALSNLIGNAVRHARQGTAVQVRIAPLPGGGGGVMVVNEGETVAPEVLARLFDRFFRADPSRAHGQRNHGLGLAITDAIARMHGGRTVATSSGGVTAIGLELPAS